MAEEVERVTDPVPETTKTKRAKDPKKVAAGRVGAAARNAKMQPRNHSVVRLFPPWERPAFL